MNQKISALHNQLREFKILHHETDAAGTKIRLLRNVNCLSCDHKAVMKTNEPVSHKLQKLAPSLSIKPFLTYELDRMRKFKDTSCAKNMNYLEAAMKQCNDVESDTKYCLRFCGGSHTKVSGEERKRVLQN